MASKKEDSTKEDKNIEALVDNFVSFQKVMTNLTEKFDNLSGQISQLLGLFESSAKVLAEKDYDKEKEEKTSKEELKKKKEIIDKLDKVLEQNKTIAKGLTLMHDKVEDHEEMLNEKGFNDSSGPGFQGMQVSSLHQSPPPKRPPQGPPQNPPKNPPSQASSQNNASPSPSNFPKNEKTDIQTHYPSGPSTNPNSGEIKAKGSTKPQEDEDESPYKTIDPSKKIGMENQSS